MPQPSPRFPFSRPPASIFPVACLAVAAALAVSGAPAAGQREPVNGVRTPEIRTHAIVGAAVVPAPGERIEDATILIRDGMIAAVGVGLAVPPEARVHAGAGLTVYPGLIDAGVLVDVEAPSAAAGRHWSANVRSEIEMNGQPALDAALRKSLRGLGFGVAAAYPSGGIIRGSGTVVALADASEHVVAYRERAAMGIGLSRGSRGGGYPGSLMGAVALVRQTLSDAEWHAACRRVYAAHPDHNEPPLRNDSLVALADVLAGDQAVLFDVRDEHDALRAARLADEFDLDFVLLAGSGLEFRRLEEIVALRVPIVLPVNFPPRPDVSTIAGADGTSLRDLMTWEQAPTNPRRLADAGVAFAFTTHRLKRREDLFGAVRRAIEHGLPADAALAALTVTPAALLDLDDVLGTIEPGKIANLVVVDGELFDEKATIRDTWVNGRRYEIEPAPPGSVAFTGRLRTDDGLDLRVEIDTKAPSAIFHLPDGIEHEVRDDGAPDDGADGEAPKSSPAKKVTVLQDQISIVVDGRPFGTEGWVRLSGALTGGTVDGTGALPDGRRFAFAIVPEETDEAGAGGEGSGGEEDEGSPEDAFEMPPETLPVPLGAYGRLDPPETEDVLIENATIWTCAEDGVIENGALLIRNGVIEAVYRRTPDALPGPDPVVRIDAAGRHITPGLIDCHSHTGISGGVNEFAQTNTAEVRIGDVVDPDDIDWYRQLAGGLVAANQLHGSANPIGGQNSVVKIKWGRPAEAFPIDGATGGIKFALGENVKRSETRYPKTRMGVETFIRDGFTAAREYEAAWTRYRALSRAERRRTMPPRRDLELDALVEILHGERIIHCHSYRQDEILMLIRVAEEFGFTIGTFQHVLEGYKVAEAIAAHGAGASSFSDWWAYKVEVMDAIPHNGSLMTDVGVLVSFNSDSDELARRMNTEAAKAVRYGGLDPHAALKLVTINPAIQLRIDDRTGSLEVGKDADFVVWSGPPLSTYSRCEQTWIEGARYFDRARDAAAREAIGREHRRLVQKILAEAHSDPSRGARAKPAPVATSIDDATRAWMEEQVRLGGDPLEVRPGECGCGMAGMHGLEEH